LTGQSTDRPSSGTGSDGASVHQPAEAKSRLVAIVWAIACVLIVAIMSGVYMVDRVIASYENTGKGMGGQSDPSLSIPQAIVDRLAGAFETPVSVSTVFIPVVHEMKEKPKFVVMTTTLNVTVKKESVKTIGWGALDLGTTSVTLRANGNRVQYFVPLEGAGMSSFNFDPEAKVLTATFPPVQVDKEIVDVQSNPAMIDIKTDVGWARLDRYSGEDLRGQAKKDLRMAVVEEAGTPLLMDKARETARKHLIRMLEPVQVALKEDVKLRVKFEDELVRD
jgi:hypothetical protein